MTYEYRPRPCSDADLLRLVAEGGRPIPNAVARAAGLSPAGDGCAHIEHGGVRSVVLAADARKLVALRLDPAALAQLQAQLTPADPSTVARLEVIERKLGHPERRQRAQQVRARKIEREYQALRAEGHDQTYARHFSAYNVDNAQRFAAQTAAHQARLAAPAAAPAPMAAPVPLRVVPKYSTQDLADLVKTF